jgi:hypothetical protein
LCSKRSNEIAAGPESDLDAQSRIRTAGWGVALWGDENALFAAVIHASGGKSHQRLNWERLGLFVGRFPWFDHDL